MDTRIPGGLWATLKLRPVKVPNDGLPVICSLEADGWNREIRACVEKCMRNKLLFVTAFLAIFMVLALSEHLFGQDRSSTTGRSWALVGATVYVSPTEPPIKNGVILIRAGTIESVGRSGSVQLPADAEKLDCSGLTITAGFWNSHVHFVQRKWANVQAIPPAELSGQMADMITRWGF